MRDDARPTPELTRTSFAVAFAATLGMMTSSPPMVAGPQGLLLIPLTHDFGIGRGTLGLMSGASLVLGAALTPFVGTLLDRYGVRRVVVPGILAFGLVQILFSILPLSVALLGCVLLLQGVASCLVTPLAYTKVISLWFRRRRGIVLGVASAFGIGGGSGIAAVLVGTLLGVGGWRLAYLGTGIYVLVVGVIFLLPLLREPAVVPRVADAEDHPEIPGLTRNEALKTRSFRLVMLLVVSCIGGLTIMLGHGPALLIARGLTKIGPYYLGCAAIGSLLGQILSGFLLDRFDSPKVGLGFALASLLGGLVILYLGTSMAIVLPAAFVLGLGQGAETGLASYYVSRFCGLRAYASIFGLVMALVTLSAGIFPAIAGYAFDLNGNYDAIIPLIDLLLVLPVVAIFFMPRYKFKADPTAM